MIELGYTHYWSQRQPEITDTQWQIICDDARKLIQASPAPIGDAFGESRKWIIDGEKIVFNGMGENSHETFILYRRGQEHRESWMDRARNPWGFMFCKTARKPYDSVVCGVLLSAYRHAPGWQRITSDGYADEQIWMDALHFTRRVLGPGYTIPDTIELRYPSRYEPAPACTGSGSEANAGEDDSVAAAGDPMWAGAAGSVNDGRVLTRVLSTLSSGLCEGLYFSEFEQRALVGALEAAANNRLTEQMAYGLASEIVAEHSNHDAFPGKSLALVFCERIEALGRMGSATGAPDARIEIGSEVETAYGPAEIRYISEDRGYAVIRLEPGGERWISAKEIRSAAA